MELFALIPVRSDRARWPALHVWRAMALLAAFVPLTGCGSKPVNPQAMNMEVRVPVTVAKAMVKTVPVQVQVIGNVEAYSNVSVRTQMAGEIERAYFKEGEDVKKGQLLFTLDRRPIEATLNQLAANLARDQAQLANAQAQAERNSKLLRTAPPTGRGDSD